MIMENEKVSLEKISLKNPKISETTKYIEYKGLELIEEKYFQGGASIKYWM